LNRLRKMQGSCLYFSNFRIGFVFVQFNPEPAMESNASLCKTFKRIFLSLIGLFLCVITVQAQLAGTYTIDPVGGAYNPGLNDNFTTFKEAADTLNSQGISGWVQINVADGIYDETFTLLSIAGTSWINNIIIQSASGDSSSVILSYSGFSPSSTSIMELNGTDYVMFQNIGFDASPGNLSYGQAVWITGGCSNIKFHNNLFIGKTGYSSYNDNRALIASWQTDDEYLEFRNNRFVYGEKGIMLAGESGGNPAGNNLIENNWFEGQTESAVYLQYQHSPQVIYNKIQNTDYSGTNGVEFQSLTGFLFRNNDVFLDDGAAGVYINDCEGQPAAEGWIYNNFISISAGSESNFGIWAVESSYMNIYHNSILVHSGADNNCRSFYQSGIGSEIDIRNNIFANSAGGYAYYVTYGAALVNSDYNNYYTTGNFVGYWGSSDLPGLSDIISNSGDDANSLFVNPVFKSTDDLHTTSTWLDKMGVAGLSTIDIENEVRDSPPDIGADEFTGVGTPLSGTYTIGGSGFDFANITMAVDSLIKAGISGDVIFNIRDDDSPYQEQIEIGPINGANPTKTITFQPDPSNTLDAVIEYDASSADNYTILLSRISHLSFKDLTLNALNSVNSNVIMFKGNCTNDSITGCIINSLGTASSTAAIYCDDALVGDIWIMNNTISDGTRGVSITGVDNPGFRSSNIRVLDNTLTGHYWDGIFLRYCDAPVVSGNTISSLVPNYNYDGIYLTQCYNDLLVSGNKILFSGDDNGIGFNYADGTSSFRGKVINNYIEAIGSTNPLVGIFIANSSYIDILFNTCKIDEDNTDINSYAFYGHYGSNLVVKNNNFVNYGTGPAYYNNPGTGITESDYNNLFTGGINLARWDFTLYARDLEDLQTKSELDDNSISINPWFISDEEPDINSSFLDGKGVAISGILTDYYGITRSDPPDIGAAEFSATLSPIAGGTYTIGGSLPDYNSISQAMEDLQHRGVAGPVTFDIRSDNYNEIVGNVYTIPGASESNHITLKSESGDPDDVVIHYLTDNAGNFNIFSFRGVSHFTLQGLTILATGTSDGRPLNLWGTYEDFTIINNTLTSSNTGSSCLMISGDHNKILIEDNTISKGSRGINLNGQVDSYGITSKVIGNNISGSQYEGIYLQYLEAPEIISNNIQNSLYNGFNGIYARYCNKDFRIIANSIISDSSDYGIYISYCDVLSPFSGLVSNNMINVGGNFTANGIYLASSSRIQLYHNSINISSTEADWGRGLFIKNTNSEVEILNNVIANTGNGYSMFVEEGNDISACDYNDLWATGGNFVSWDGTAYADLGSLQTGSSMNVNSISQDPLFYSDSDLHSTQPALNQAATPLTDVPFDIDSVPRDPSQPDIGAAEFTCQTPDFNVFVSETCLGDTTILIDSSQNVAPGSTYGWDIDGDYVPDLFTDNTYDTLKYFFDTPGDHTVNFTISQIAGCVNSEAVIVTVHSVPILDLNKTDAYCGDDDGQVDLEVSGGTGPYSFFWSDGSISEDLTNLARGTYTVVVSDANKCASTEEVIIENRMQVSVIQLQEANCGDSSGIAVASASGGTAPYTYIWANGVRNDTSAQLSPGTHYVRVRDNAGCTARGHINMGNNGTGPQISLQSITHNDCNGDYTGAIDISITGGTAPYEVIWSNNCTTEDQSSLQAGMYDV
jgi:parallel beta-helix repeat protein